MMDCSRRVRSLVVDVLPTDAQRLMCGYQPSAALLPSDANQSARDNIITTPTSFDARSLVGYWVHSV